MTTLVLVLLCTATLSNAWTQYGHLLVGEIARSYMTANEVSIIERLLQRWDADFPGTSDLATVGSWADVVQCGALYPCPPQLGDPAFGALIAWHDTRLPYAIRGATVPYDLAVQVCMSSVFCRLKEPLLKRFNTLILNVKF